MIMLKKSEFNHFDDLRYHSCSNISKYVPQQTPLMWEAQNIYHDHSNFTEMSGKCGVLANWQCSNKTTMNHLQSYWLGTCCCSKAMNQIQAHNLGLFCPGAAIRLFKYGFQEAFVRSWGWYSHSWMGITNCASPWKQREIRKKPH